VLAGERRYVQAVGEGLDDAIAHVVACVLVLRTRVAEAGDETSGGRHGGSGRVTGA